MSSIDLLRAPLFVSWELTRGCNLACVHCCACSAPGGTVPGELARDAAVRLAEDIAAGGVPYLMLCGGEPLTVPWFFEIAGILGEGGVELKIESNGQLLGPDEARRLAKLPIRSVQISIDGDTQRTYSRQRPGASLEKAHAACRAVREAGLPLEVTFAPTRLNVHEAEAVMDRAAALGAFRFNTGALMRLGRAAKLWKDIAPTSGQYAAFRAGLERKKKEIGPDLELRWSPFTIEEGLEECLLQPPATLLVLPDGRVKVAAVLPYTCADLRRQSLAEAWDAYRRAWARPEVREACARVLADPARLAEADRWLPLRSGKERGLVLAAGT
ncbi:MAG: radical SAM protein [Elusimicrobiota bacterium]